VNLHRATLPLFFLVSRLPLPAVPYRRCGCECNKRAQIGKLPIFFSEVLPDAVKTS
jgi:hypothetical protein